MSRWWETGTLRFRLALWYGVGGAVLLALFSATVYLFVADRMARPLDHQLRGDLHDVRQRLEVRPGRRILWDGREIPEHVEWNADDPWFELWDEHGQLVRRYWPFQPSRVALPPIAPARSRDTVSIFNIAPDITLRVLSVPYSVPGHADGWMIRVMHLHTPIGDALAALRLIMLVALPIVIALLVIGGYLITRAWLSPLDRMVAEANRISAYELSRRLPVANPRDELGRLASVFNVTLDRLAASFMALDRFVADASHELRTPLTTLRSVGEVGLRRSRTVDEYREIIGSMLEEAQRLQLLIQRLLELATAEGGAPALQRTRLRLDEFVSGCVGELAILAEHRNQQLALDTKPCTTTTDPVLFRQALQNLVDNAIKYSPEHSTIRVSVREVDGQFHIAVTDEGPGISPENRVHLTERFFRPDRARGRDKGGFGLGLSITKAYMRLLGGSIDYEPTKPQGGTFRLTLPKA